MRNQLLACLALLTSLPAAASEIRGALPDQIVNFNRSISGGTGSVTWHARNMLVGQTSTFALVAGGDPIYLPARPGKDGLAFLEVNFGPLGIGFCSGSLMNGGTAILTAAHCVADTSGNIAAVGGFAYFYPGPNDPFYDLDFGFEPGIERVALDSFYVAPGYTGDVIDHNDLAIIFLGGAAPGFAVEYDLAALSDPTGVDFNVAGFGNRGTGGAAGASPGSFGRLREGDNKFEYAFGNPLFGGGWATELGEPLSQISDSWVSDFDRVGFAANDTSCLVTDALFGTGTTFCDSAGVGAREAGVAGGDSGGPQFVGGKIVSVTSYGLTFGDGFGDFGGGLNSGWGEFSGYAPVFRNRSWIESLVPTAFGDVIDAPAPGALALFGLGAALLAARTRTRRA